MKLQLVPARTGMKWVHEGIRAFLRMPLAFASLFLMFVVATKVLSLIPVIGIMLALALLPAATVGLMAATREILDGRLPQPATLVVAFRQSPRQTRAILLLGVIYVVAMLLIVFTASLLNDGQLEQLVAKYGGQNLRPELLLADPALQQAARAAIRQMLVSCLLYVPVSTLLWHAPALVHWRGVPVGKSLFFSAVAVLRNAPAYLVYGLGWMAVCSIAWAGLLILTALSGNIGFALSGLEPLSLLIACMFYASLWFTFRDSFADDETPPPATS